MIYMCTNIQNDHLLSFTVAAIPEPARRIRRRGESARPLVRLLVRRPTSAARIDWCVGRASRSDAANAASPARSVCRVAPWGWQASKSRLTLKSRIFAAQSRDATRQRPSISGGSRASKDRPSSQSRSVSPGRRSRTISMARAHTFSSRRASYRDRRSECSRRPAFHRRSPHRTTVVRLAAVDLDLDEIRASERVPDHTLVPAELLGDVDLPHTLAVQLDHTRAVNWIHPAIPNDGAVISSAAG